MWTAPKIEFISTPTWALFPRASLAQSLILALALSNDNPTLLSLPVAARAPARPCTDIAINLSFCVKIFSEYTSQSDDTDDSEDSKNNSMGIIIIIWSKIHE